MEAHPHSRTSRYGGVMLRQHAIALSPSNKRTPIEFVFDGKHWKVYRREVPRNWHVTVGRQWHCQRDAQSFIEEKGYMVEF